MRQIYENNINLFDLIYNYISRHKRRLVYNSKLFIGNVDRILNEKYYMDTEEKLSFYTTIFFIKKQKQSIKLHNLCIEPRRIFVLVDKYSLSTEAVKDHRQRNNYLVVENIKL